MRAESGRLFRSYRWKDASFRICSSHFEDIAASIRLQRAVLENYIHRHPEFLTALEPLPSPPGAPAIVRKMCAAAEVVGVGPMAAVAGSVAQIAAEAALAQGAAEAIVENGGDIYLAATRSVVVGLYAGDHVVSGNLAARVAPRELPLAICSSSSHMGRSMSLGHCDLATVAAEDAALADAAATHACNLVRGAEDIEATLESIVNLPGVRGVLIAEEGRVGLAGDFPEIIRHRDPNTMDKISS